MENRGHERGIYVNRLEIVELSQVRSECKTLDFRTVVTEAIDEAFTKLGQTISCKLYSLLENHYELCREEIPERTDKFVDVLEQVFGASALLIEIEIMKNIRQRVPRFEFRVKDRYVAFDQYLDSLRAYLDTA
jgi:hypothetical protein